MEVDEGGQSAPDRRVRQRTEGPDDDVEMQDQVPNIASNVPSKSYTLAKPLPTVAEEQRYVMTLNDEPRFHDKMLRELIGAEYAVNYTSRAKMGLLHVDPLLTCSPNMTPPPTTREKAKYRDIHLCFNPNCSAVPRKRKEWTDPGAGYKCCVECHDAEVARH